MYDSDSNSELCRPSIVVDKHVHNESRRRKPKPHKYTSADEYLEYLNINNFSNSRDYDGRTHTTYTEHREYIKITHANDLEKGTIKTAIEKTSAEKQVDVPAGSRMFGGFIIPPFFSLNKKASKADNDLTPSTGNFLVKILNKIIAPPTKDNEGENDDVIGQRMSFWEERKKAGAFLDNYLRDCMSKESSIYSPEEKVQMKRIQDILVREKEEEREKEREVKEKEDEERERKEWKKKVKAKKEKKEGESRRKKKRKDDDSDERETTLGTELSGEHPLFARKFREKVRIYTKSGTEVNVNKNGVSVVKSRSRTSSEGSSEDTDETIDLVQAIREENERTQRVLKRVFSNEAEWCSSTMEPKHTRSHRIHLAGDVEVEFSHKVMEENRKMLHKLQVDQAEDIKMNKMIIEENKRTLKKLKMEQVKEKLRRSLNTDDVTIKKTPSGRFLKEQKKISSKKSKNSIIDTSVCSNSNLGQDSVENEITSESEEFVKRKPKKKAWSTEMLSKKEKAEQKNARKVITLDSVRGFNKVNTAKNSEAATRRKPIHLAGNTLENKNNVQMIQQVEEKQNSDDKKVILRNKRSHERKLDMKKSTQADKCIQESNVVRVTRKDPNESVIVEYRCEKNHEELGQKNDSKENLQTVRNLSMTVNEDSSSRNDTVFGPSSIESMIRDKKKADLTRSLVPMQMETLSDCSLYDQNEYSTERNTIVLDFGSHTTSNGDEDFYPVGKCNEHYCYEDIHLKDGAIKQNTKTQFSSEDECKESSCMRTRKRLVTKRREASRHNVDNTTSKESMVKSIKLRNDAVNERRKYMSNRRKKTHGCDQPNPTQIPYGTDSRKMPQIAYRETYQEVQSKLQVLGKVLKEVDKAKRDEQVLNSDYSLNDKISGKQKMPIDRVFKTCSEKASMSTKGSCSAPRSKRAGLVVSKKRLGFNFRGSHKDNHARNRERKHQMQDQCYINNPLDQNKPLCWNPHVTENRRHHKQRERNRKEEGMLVDSNKIETKSKLTALLKRVNRKTEAYSILSQLIEQDQFDSSSSENDLVPDLRFVEGTGDNGSKYITNLNEKPKESTSEEWAPTAKHRKISPKLLGRHKDTETKLIHNRESSNKRKTQSKKRVAPPNKEKSPQDLPNLEPETKVFHKRESLNQRKNKNNIRVASDEESDRDLPNLEPEKKDYHKSLCFNQRKTKSKKRIATPSDEKSVQDLPNLEPETKVFQKRESFNRRNDESIVHEASPFEDESDKGHSHLETKTKVLYKRPRFNQIKLKSDNRIASPDEKECGKNLKWSKNTVHVAQEQNKKREMKGNRILRGHYSDVSRLRDGQRSKKHERSKHRRKHKDETQDEHTFRLQSFRSKDLREDSGLQNQVRDEEGRAYCKSGKYMNRINQEKRNEAPIVCIDITKDCENLCRVHDVKEDSYEEETRRVQENSILLQKANHESSEQIRPFSKNFRSRQMIEHMSTVLSEYLATNRQHGQTEEVDDDMKKERQEDDELREAVENVRRQIRADDEIGGWKVTDASLVTGEGIQECANRDALQKSMACRGSHNVISKHSHYLSTEKKEPFDRAVNHTDVKQRDEETIVKCERGDGIFHPVESRYPAQMCSGKPTNVLPSGPAENDENIITSSHKRSKALELISDKQSESNCCKYNNKDIQPGLLTKLESNLNSNAIKSVGGGFVTKKVSSSPKEKLLGGVLNNENFNHATGGVLKKHESSEKSQNKMFPKVGNHVSLQNFDGCTEKCADCMTEDINLRSQCSPMVHDHNVGHECVSTATSSLLIEKPYGHKTDGQRHFDLEECPKYNGEFKHEGKPIGEMSSEDDNRIDCRKDVASCGCDTSTVISCIDTPDQAINQIFKKMDDVIINRFLTLASVNGITIVVTPQVVVNERVQDNSESNDECTELKAEKLEKEKLIVNDHDTMGVMVKSNEESLKVAKVSNTNKEVVSNKVMVDYKKDNNMYPKESHKNEKEVIMNIQPEGSIPVEMKSVVSNEGSEAKATTIISNPGSKEKTVSNAPKKKKSTTRPFKSNLYFINQTFCKSSDTLRRDKKYHVRLNRTKATKTGSKVRKVNDRRHSEPERNTHQVDKGKPIVVDATIPDCSVPVVAIDMPDTQNKRKEIYYDQCYAEILHCLPSEIHCNDSKHRMGKDSSRIPNKEIKNKKEIPVDKFLEKVRNNLDVDEMKLLEAASKTTVNILAERRCYDPNDLDVIFCKEGYNNFSSASSVVPPIKTIEEIIAEADSNDNLVSICDCFGVDNISDLMDHLKSISGDEVAYAMESRQSKKKSDKKQKQKHKHKEMKTDKKIYGKESHHKQINGNGVEMRNTHSKRQSKNIFVDPSSWHETTNRPRPPHGNSFRVNDIWNYCKRPKVNDINKWMRAGELATTGCAREEETSLLPYEDKKNSRKGEVKEISSKETNADSCLTLSNFILNYALKSGIILADTSTTDITKEDPDAEDTFNVKIELNDDGCNKKTSIVIEVPEAQDFKLASKMYKGAPAVAHAQSPLHSTAQIVHVDSEEIVLTTDSTEEPEWTTVQEEAFQIALKKHPPTPNVWDRIAKSVGRSKRDCVLHFMGIWRRLESTDG